MKQVVKRGGILAAFLLMAAQYGGLVIRALSRSRLRLSLIGLAKFISRLVSLRSSARAPCLASLCSLIGDSISAPGLASLSSPIGLIICALSRSRLRLSLIGFRFILCFIALCLSAQTPRTAKAETAARGGLVSEVLRLSPVSLSARKGAAGKGGSTDKSGARQNRQAAAPRVALTLDLCMGQTDMRIFSALLRYNIPATLFVTRLWLENSANRAVLEQIRARPQQFEIGNHGANHIPAIDNRPYLYGLKTAGTAQRACAEAMGGLKAISRAGLRGNLSRRFWYRGAGALYSPDIMRLLRRADFSIAGFSVNGDAGASLSAQAAFRSVSAAKDGDVIIAHMNQPRRAAGQGVAAAIAALRQRGYNFVALSQALPEQTAFPHIGTAKMRRRIPLAAPDNGAQKADSWPNCSILLK